jgi:hypothetical protein
MPKNKNKCPPSGGRLATQYDTTWRLKLAGLFSGALVTWGNRNLYAFLNLGTFS